MTKINFYIEENDLIRQLINIKENKGLKISLSTMETVCEKEVCALFAPPDFYSISVNDQTVGEIVYGQDQDGDVRDTLLRLEIVLDKAAHCEILGQAPGAGAASLFHAGLGALVVTNDFACNEQWNDDRMFLVTSPQQVALALRKLYLVAKVQEDLLPRYCMDMFENLYFHASPTQIKATGLRYEDVIAEVIKHFSYLNDLSGTDFESLHQPHEIMQRAGAYGVDISPESPNTHRDRKAMSMRNITIDGQLLCCEWHTKLAPRQGRIHFYAWRDRPKEIKAITGEKVIVGIITDHLK